jgi:hypothetical protein
MWPTFETSDGRRVTVNPHWITYVEHSSQPGCTIMFALEGETLQLQNSGDAVLRAVQEALR